MWYNTPMSWLLRSPMHRMMSKSMLLITVIGRKSGKRYTLPVNYIQDGQILWITSQRDRAWWRNLQAGAPVEVLLRGKPCRGQGIALVKPTQVAQSLAAYLTKVPQYAKYYNVRLDEAGTPLAEDLDRASAERVVIRIDLVDS